MVTFTLLQQHSENKEVRKQVKNNLNEIKELREVMLKKKLYTVLTLVLYQ